jgi:pimeloyl-ACP methyl ester carboxylesterase
MIWNTDTELRFNAGGHELEGRCLGPSPDAAPTIVMLHEGLGSMRLWKDLPEQLVQATGCGVFAYSRAGYGRSDSVSLPRPLDYMTREAVDVLPDVLDAMGINHAILLGHSDGATIVLIYAGSTQDHRVRGVIALAPHLFNEDRAVRSIAEAKTAFETGDLRERLARHHDDVDAAFRGWNDAWLDPGFSDWSVEECVDYIRVPVLAIQGRDDQYGTLAQIDALAAALHAPFECVILDDCRHALFVDQPEKTLAAITEFMARLRRIDEAEAAA